MALEKVELKYASVAAMDWLVSKCMGLEPVRTDGSLKPVFCKSGPVLESWPAYCSDPAETQRLIEQNLIATNPEHHSQHCSVAQDWQERGYLSIEGWHWQAHVLGPDNLDEPYTQEGASPGIAVVRCFLASRVGEVVLVPKEFV